jgi:hypothetical protein
MNPDSDIPLNIMLVFSPSEILRKRAVKIKAIVNNITPIFKGNGTTYIESINGMKRIKYLSLKYIGLLFQKLRMLHIVPNINNRIPIFSSGLLKMGIKYNQLADVNRRPSQSNGFMVVPPNL